MPRCRTAVAGSLALGNGTKHLRPRDVVRARLRCLDPRSFFKIPPHLLYVSFIYANINTDVGRNAESLSLQSEFNCGYAGMTQTLLGGRPCDKTVMDEFGYSITTHT